MAKGWTEERRRRQAEMIRKHKPWEKSTGPRSAAGKARSRMNAVKSGMYGRYGESAQKMLRHSREFLRYAAATELEKAQGLNDFVRNEVIKNILKAKL